MRHPNYGDSGGIDSIFSSTGNILAPAFCESFGNQEPTNHYYDIHNEIAKLLTLKFPNHIGSSIEEIIVIS